MSMNTDLVEKYIKTIDRLKTELNRIEAEYSDLEEEWNMHGGEDGIMGMYHELEEVKKERDAAIETLKDYSDELKAYRAIGTTDRLAELEKADKEGRCEVLPVEVGQSVYFVNRAFDSEICYAFVTRAEINLYTPSCPVWLKIEWFSKRTGKHEYYDRADLMLGKTVFFTQEEAEKALKK